MVIADFHIPTAVGKDVTLIANIRINVADYRVKCLKML